MWRCLLLSAAIAENPIRKITTLLQNLSEEVTDEGVKEKQLFDEFMCYCKKNKEKSTLEIESGEARIGNLESTIKELAGSNNQLTSEIEELSTELAEDQKSINEASRVRKQEERQYEQESLDVKTSIASLDQAIPAIQKGLEAQPSFLETSMIQQLKPILVQYQSMLTGAGIPVQEDILAMLQSGTAGSGEIIGILEQMRDGFKENLIKATKEEEEAVQAFSNLMMSKTREVKASTAEIDEKKERRATQMQLKSDAQEDHEDTSNSLASAQSFVRDLNKSCSEKAEEFELGERTRTDELLAIQDTIKILSDDSGLDIVKTAEPVSFLQMPRSLATNGISFLMEKTVTKKEKFWKLKKMVHKMISDLKQAQKDDDKKLQWCKEEIATSEDEEANVKDHVVHHQQEYESGDQERKDVSDAIALLKSEITDIDNGIQDASAVRKDEKALFLKTLTEIQIAGQLLHKARDRLAKMYQPVARALIQRDAADMLDLSFLQESKPGRVGAAGGVLSMIDGLRHKLELEEQQLQNTEKVSQADFDETLEASQKSRKAKKEDIVNKEATLGRVKEQMAVSRGKLQETREEKKAIEAKLMSLHKSCDFLLTSFDDRKKARANELDGLQKSLGILSGADFDVSKPTPEPKEVLENAQFLQTQN